LGFFISVILMHNQFMLRIGLTGGIGSGKSTVARIFEVLGIPVYYADEASKRLYHTDEALKKDIIEHFGAAMYVNGRLDRAKMASVVFGDPEKLSLLNQLVHPPTIRDAEDWMKRQTSPYVVKEAALIFESGSGAGLDYIIGVSAPQALRIKRVMDREGVSREEVLKRASRQIDESIKMRLCDFVIVNNEQEMVFPQVLELHGKLMKESNS
jgi:dephospho-CoA kinase